MRPAGVGKSSDAYEVSHQLARRDVPHALSDSDESDRVRQSDPASMIRIDTSDQDVTAVALRVIDLWPSGFVSALTDGS
ncbi:hypothetical protein GCM10010191_89290 [Actinomadura vinacea]|uniref:DUF397 domain-containing protein n=1 Tax=Actinomadura vinacea TaxID=115336 RepID=A0ABP5XHF3_9ACTN